MLLDVGTRGGRLVRVLVNVRVLALGSGTAPPPETVEGRQGGIGSMDALAHDANGLRGPWATQVKGLERHAADAQP